MTRRYSKATVIKELNAQIGSYETSYVEFDGFVREPYALKSIACLKQAIEAVRAYRVRPGADEGKQ